MIAIRPMTFDDYDAVLALMRGAPGVAVRAADSPAAIQRYLTRNPGLSFVAESDDRLIGCIFGGHDGRRGSLLHLAVAADFQRQGVGRRLVERALAGLAAEGILKSHIDVFADNRGAIAFWQRLGWVKRDDICRFSFNNSSDPNV
ncbi:GCN5-related N-acetyltransferase [Candidatus Promineifilum breve]|uniref:GCN5-related N-acetyltransferase n=1 Tax=Candidatus Promineifilum breve TaxID=1806508 RepID=A0A160T0W6_9CHLR|nr:GNAT family N-acetyltransferase [Candidatus Promineifilum breve]CUS02398.2 GCN5-related N-acetyltransferase [Candidatus Promineifilum breve]